MHRLASHFLWALFFNIILETHEIFVTSFMPSENWLRSSQQHSQQPSIIGFATRAFQVALGSSKFGRMFPIAPHFAVNITLLWDTSPTVAPRPYAGETQRGTTPSSPPVPQAWQPHSASPSGTSEGWSCRQRTARHLRTPT